MSPGGGGSATSLAGTSAGGAGGVATAATGGVGTAGNAGMSPTAGTPTGQGGSAGSASTPREGFWVDGRFLRDRCGEKVILRGVNEMVVWSPDQTGATVFPEIAKTGANVVRIVWTIKDGVTSNLDLAIQNAVTSGMIPMVELHDATGKFELLGSLVDHWTKPEVVAVMQKHAAHVLLNIGNEVGDKVEDATFTAGYTDAITRLRAAGLGMPLIIDGSGYGQNLDQLQSQGPGLLAKDPLANLLFSVHMWWTDGTAAKIQNELAESVALNLPLIVGEFAHHAVWQCSTYPFDYVALMAQAKAQEIGYLAWSWGQVKNGDCADDGPFDMTTDGTFAGLTGWGKEVAVTDANSIMNTSVRVPSLNGEACP